MNQQENQNAQKIHLAYEILRKQNTLECLRLQNETLRLEIRSQQEENALLGSILSILMLLANGGVNLTAVVEQLLSSDAMTDTNRPDTTDQTNP